MSIVIRGMDKPTDCGLCPFEDFGYCAVKGERNTSEKGIDDDCPLVEIKEYTLKNGHKVVVADTPQTDLFVKTPHKSRESHEKDTPQTDCSVITDTSCQVLDGWQTREKPKTTDCGWK